MLQHVHDGMEQREEKRERADQQHGLADLPDDGHRRVSADGVRAPLPHGGFPPRKQRPGKPVRRPDDEKRQRDDLQGVEQGAEILGLQPVQDLSLPAEIGDVNPPEQQQIERGGEDQQRKIAPDPGAQVRDDRDVQRDVRREHHGRRRLLINPAHRREQVCRQHQHGENAEQDRVPQAALRVEMFRRHGAPPRISWPEIFFIIPYSADRCQSPADPQPFHRVRIRRGEHGLVSHIDDHAGLRALRLADEAHRRVIDRDVRRASAPAVVRGDQRGRRDGRRGGLLSAQGEDHVRARDVLGVEPQVVLFRALQGQQVVLPVVAPREDGKPVARAEFQRLPLPAAPLRASFRRAEISLPGQLGADLVQVALAGGAAQLLEHGVQVGELLPALFDLYRKNFLRRFRLSVFLVIFLGVLRGRQERVERDADGRLARFVEIGQLGGGKALFQPVKVRVEQVAGHAQFVPPGAAFEVRLLGVDPAAQPLGGVRQHAEQVQRAGVDALEAVPLAVKRVQQFRKAGLARDHSGGAVLGDGQERKVQRLSGEVDGHIRGAVRVFDRLRQAADEKREPPELLLRHLSHAELAAAPDEVLQLAADDGRKALQRGKQGFGEPRAGGRGADARDDLLPAGRQQAQLVLRRRKAVLHPRKDQPLRRHRGVHTPEGVDDLPILPDEDDVAVAAHHLHGQREEEGVPQLADRFEIEAQHPLQAGLAHGAQPRP